MALHIHQIIAHYLIALRLEQRFLDDAEETGDCPPHARSEQRSQTQRPPVPLGRVQGSVPPRLSRHTQAGLSPKVALSGPRAHEKTDPKSIKNKPKSTPKTALFEDRPLKTLAKMNSAVETHGKTWDRIQKAMKEFDECCQRAGASSLERVGLAAFMQPILEKADGVLEKCLVPRPKPDCLFPDEKPDDEMPTSTSGHAPHAIGEEGEVPTHASDKTGSSD